MKGRMPTGVVSPRMAASMVDAKPRRPVIARETWDERARKKLLDRKTLMDAARAGKPAAVARLWQEYRCRILRETDPQ